MANSFEKQLVQPSGILIPIEINSLKFQPKRIFYVTNVPAWQERGEHAHYETMQYLICIQGKILIYLFDGVKEYNFFLEPGQHIFVDKMIWDSETYITGNDILLSICSTNYDPKDCIENKEQFIKLVRNKNA